MSVLTSTVDRVQVNFETPFTYTLQVGLSEMNEDISSIQLTTFIPDYIIYQTPTVTWPITSVEERKEENGTRLVYNIDPTKYDGISFTLYLQCQFRFPTEQTTYDNSFTLFVNGEPVPKEVKRSQTVSLSLTADFRVSIEQVVPDIYTAAGEYSGWYILIKNFGDAGAPLTDFSMTVNLPEETTLIEQFPIRGTDISNNQFADSSFDGRSPDTIADDLTSFTFSLPGEYTGTEYKILFITDVSSSLNPNQYISTLTWSSEENPLTTVGYIMTIQDPVYDISIEATTPLFVQDGKEYYASLHLQNTGNMELIDTSFSVDIAPSLNFTKLETGTLGIPNFMYAPNIEYTLVFTYSNGEGETSSSSIDGFSTNVNSVVTAEQLNIPDGYYLTSISTVFPYLVAGIQTIEEMLIYGIVDNSETESTSIQFHAQAITETPNGELNVITNEDTSINENVSFVIEKEQQLFNLLDNYVYPDGTIRYTAHITTPLSNVYAPILVDVLPSQVTYVGNERYVYYSFLEDTTYDSFDTETEFPLPILRPTEETLEDGTRIVRFSFTDENKIELNRLDTLDISFDVQVVDASLDNLTISNKMYWGNFGSKGYAGPNMENYLDNYLDVDDDSLYPENLAQSNTVITIIEPLSGLIGEAGVRGIKGSAFVKGDTPVGVPAGDTVTFRIQLTNPTTMNLYNLELIDIFPYVGDTSILNPKEERGSDFPLEYVDFSIRVTPSKEEPVPSFLVSYSDNVDPVRFDEFNNKIGSGRWYADPPATVRAIKFTQDNTPFQTGQVITVDLTLQVPKEQRRAARDVEGVAYNSFATRASYQSEQSKTTYLAPIEPYKRGVRELGEGTIEGIVFYDINRNGLYDGSDPGRDGYYITLHNESGEEIASTYSTTMNSQTGSYSFNNLVPGNYYLIFTPNDSFTEPTTQVLTARNGSLPDKNGITPMITITSENNQVQAYAGFISRRTDFVIQANAQVHKTLKSSVYNTMLLDIKLNELRNLL